LQQGKYTSLCRNISLICSKLFENLELNVQYEDLSYKCSINDYDFTSNVHDKMFRSPGYSRQIKYEGHFDDYNVNTSDLKDMSTVVASRRGEKFTRQVTENGTTTTKNFYRYIFMAPIHHGLAQNNKVLPAGVHVNLSFHRASPRKALLDISSTNNGIEQRAIPIVDPVLHVCWAYSQQLDQQMALVRTNGLEIPFSSSHVRHRVLDDGLNEHTVQISQGALPERIVFFLMDPAQFSGSMKLSSTRFSMHGLKEFSLLLDNEVMQHYPLKKQNIGDTTFSHEFYRRWLQVTDQYTVNDDDVIDEVLYVNSNFMIAENFQDTENKDGVLTVKLAFDETLNNKLLLCWMPVTEKILKFDRNLSVHVS